jgi:hypothetical protein
MTSSYGMTSPPYEAIVRRDSREIGPVRLPELHAEQFIEDFNRTYRSLQLVIADIRTPSTLPSNSSSEG